MSQADGGRVVRLFRRREKPARPHDPDARDITAEATGADQPSKGKKRRRKQSSRKSINKYGFALTDQQIAAGRHRKRVGGRWEEIGRLQFEYLVAQGLTPDAHLLDIGCGALRGGIHFVRYLDPRHYYGIDANRSLIRAARKRELPEAGLQGRLPPENLRVTNRFECDFGIPFEFALAQSLFTHLPLNHIRLCLYQVAKVMRPGGRFFATFFEAPAHIPFDQSVQQLGPTTHPERDSYHYYPADLEWAATSVAPWEFDYLGDWGHPRGQKMVMYRRVAQPSGQEA